MNGAGLMKSHLYLRSCRHLMASGGGRVSPKRLPMLQQIAYTHAPLLVTVLLL